MTRYLTIDEVFSIHGELIRRYGGAADVHDLGKIESAVAQPRMTFDGVDLYPTIIDKAAAIGFSLACNHGFVDGNKRVGFGALDVFLRLNGFRIVATIEDIYATFIALADHKLTREQFLDWVRAHAEPIA